jgi:serine/threonine-protein kinase RsbW
VSASPPPDVVELSFPADARYLVLARLSLAGIAPAAPLDAETLADLKLAVTEACANAVRHAYAPDAPGDVHVRIELGDARVAIEIADRGKGLATEQPADWDPEELREQGMGFAIIRSVVDDVDIGAGADGRGTTVRMVKRLEASAG